MIIKLTSQNAKKKKTKDVTFEVNSRLPYNNFFHILSYFHFL